MNNTINLQLQPFKPTRDDIDVIDCDTSISKSLNSALPFTSLELNKTREILGIRDDQIENSLKNALLKYLELKNVSGNQIVFGFGSYSILERLVWKILPKKTMIGDFPQFPYIAMEYILAGGTYKGIWNNDFSLPYKKILDEIETNPSLSVIYINNPNNPTGAVYSIDELITIIDAADKKGIYTIVDEVYADTLPVSYSLTQYVNTYTNLIVVRSFSKIFGMQNERLGYMISSQNIIDTYKRKCNWNEITNISALAALKLLDNNRYLNKIKQNLIENKRKLTSTLVGQGFLIVDTDERVPLMFISNKNLKKIKAFFQNKNIKVGSSDIYKKLDSTFSNTYVRLRVPNDSTELNTLINRICLS